MTYKTILFACAVVAYAGAVRADCVATTKTYTACKPGYYLSGGDCISCPSSGGVAGRTADNNTGDITSCYIPSGTSFSDGTGSGVYSGNCYYSK